MLSSLRGRNVALMAGMLFLGQLLTMSLVAAFVIVPQADRIATILARNVEMVGATLDALPREERSRFIARINAGRALRIQLAQGEPPGVDGTPTWLETLVLQRLAANLGQVETMVWRGGGRSSLWVRMRLGMGEHYWVSLPPSMGWTPTGALLGAVSIGLVLSLAAGLALQRRVNRPLTALADAVDAMPDTQPLGSLAKDGPVEIAGVAAAFERMAARLAAQEADRAFMLAGISHDLKTPIAKLRLAAALRPNGEPDDDAMIARQFERIERMLDQFLDFGRGIDAEQPRRIDIRKAVSDVAMSAGLGSACVRGERDVFAMVRPIAFERTLANIIRNAFVHGSEPVSIVIGKEGAGVTVEIIDSGGGVDPALLDQLDNPFFRGDAARPSDGGVGLGLAIAARFAREHGGSLRFANGQAGGFSVKLVLATA
ncbi:MAG: ATP-binding protein [Sphingomonadaceae bacterium]